MRIWISLLALSCIFLTYAPYTIAKPGDLRRRLPTDHAGEKHKLSYPEPRRKDKISSQTSITKTLSAAGGKSTNTAGALETSGTAGSNFAGDVTLPAKALYDLAKANSGSKDSIVASYGYSTNSKQTVGIKSDWLKLPNSSAYYFVADMDVDCDGIDYKCQGNTDGQPQTDFGAMSATKVPWAVIPEKFANAHSELKPNSLVAVVCNNILYYGIFADTNGDSPQILGEASLLMAQTCFGGAMNGGNGHTSLDVLYIFFTGNNAVVPGVGQNYISDFGKLQTLGDTLMSSLISDLKMARATSVPAATNIKINLSTQTTQITTATPQAGSAGPGVSNTSNGKNPTLPSDFAGSLTVPIKALLNLAQKNIQSSSSVVATYPASPDDKSPVSIKKDWASLARSSAFYFIADMDVDCDGIDWRCKGNPDGQAQTNFGALSATKVPFVVIPDKFANAHPELQPNALVAVVCNGILYYGIFGDTDGDTPQVIGEASILIAQTCFGPTMNGAVGHTAKDVLYIFFTGQNAVVPGVGQNYISDFGQLRSLGDKLMNNLMGDLQLS